MNRVIAFIVGYSPSRFFLMLIPLSFRPEMTLCFSSSGRGVSSGTYTHLLRSSSSPTSVSRSHEIERLEMREVEGVEHSIMSAILYSFLYCRVSLLNLICMKVLLPRSLMLPVY